MRPRNRSQGPIANIWMDQQHSNSNLGSQELRIARSPTGSAGPIHSWYSNELGQLRVVTERKALKEVENRDSSPNQGNSPVANSSDEYVDKQPDKLGRKDQMRLPRMIADSLDPFVTVAGDVSSHQRSLIQFYVRDLATSMFSVTSTPLYSPTAATGIPCVSESKVAIQWICILASEVMHAMSGQERGRQVARQWSQGYRALSTALRRRDRNFQEAMMGIAIAGLTQYAFGNAQGQNLHATAADMMVHSKGTIANALAMAPDLEPFYFAAQFAFGRSHIASLQRLEFIKSAWLTDLKFLLTSRKSLHQRSETVRSNDLTKPKLDQSTIAEFSTREAEVVKLAVESTRATGRLSPFARAMQLTLVSELAWTIIQFLGRPHLAISAFKRFQFICTHSMIGGGSGLQTCELRSAALGTMFSRARRDALTEHCPDEVARSDAEVTKMHINALKMFHYLKPEGQDLLLAKICYWLTRDEEADSRELYDEGDIEDLSSQITETWYEARAQN